jgi:hypothetical protein
MIASVARQLRWACFHDGIEFAAAELMRLEGDFCRFAGEGQEVWRQGAETGVQRGSLYNIVA